jgi:predicted Holliday junction resolvase-like endonuclease
MSINQEFVISLLIQLLILAFFVGVYVTTIKFMQAKIDEIKQALKEDKAELKSDMKRYNNYLERLIRLEDSDRAAHRRIDEIKDKLL